MPISNRLVPDHYRTRLIFIISWATNISLVVQTCTNLSNPVWQPVATNGFTDGTSDFNDPQGTDYPGRFFRLRRP